MRQGMFVLLISVTVFAQQKNSVADLSWLTGHWELVKGERRTDEVWLAPAGNMMFAVSRTIRGEKPIEHEFIVIDQDSVGDIYYRAQPSRQQGTSFRLTSVQPNAAVFENLQHDFPQRIIYRKISDDSLIARIEGTRNGTLRGVEFPYKKIRN